MFRKIQFCLLLTTIAIGAIYAQPTLTLDSQMPVIGEQYDILLAQVGNFDPGSGGADRTWDFSDFQPENLLELYYQTLELKDAPSDNRFAKADFVWYFQAFGAYNYFTIGEDRFDQIGTVSISANGQINNVLVFEQPEATLQYPATYETAYSYTARVASYVGTNTSPQVTFGREGQVEFDGYGTLTTPNGLTYDNVLRMVVTVSNDIIEGLIEKQYAWVIPGSFYPVMVYNTDNDPEGTSFLYYAKNKPGDANPTGILEKAPTYDYGLRLAGNPTQRQLKLIGWENLPPDVSLQLVSSRGQALAIYTPQAVLDLDNVPAGTYYLIVRSDQGIQTIPFIKMP